MSIVKKLKDAKSLDDLANILGYKASGLSAIIYMTANNKKYSEFDIPKSSGGVRKIKAPNEKLKLLQQRLAKLLYAYLEEIENKEKPFKTVAHGFVKKRSIITNATVHRRRRYVLNLDLADFFPTINFGRVRGVFIKDRRFEFDPNIATRIAQIACHDNALPQGSPCSPVISNIVGRLLDVRLVRLARDNKCTYSRYADDITFSTNLKYFPVDLAYPDPAVKGGCLLGAKLVKEIQGTGFQINPKKTRMQYRNSRQLVTGLLANEKANVRPEYYRTVRAMCSALFKTGSYHRTVPASLVGGAAGDPDVKQEHDKYPVLEGMLSHVYLVRNTIDRRESADKKKEPTATRVLYHRFLFYKNFIAAQKPLVITEGKTDPVYLKAAVERQVKFHPRLGAFDGKAFKHNVRFMKFTSTIHDVLQLGNGVDDLKFMILNYAEVAKKFKGLKLSRPVILLIDNDKGTKDIFAVVRQKAPIHSEISLKTTDKFYRIVHNLYVVKTPEIGKAGTSCIEDLFEPAVRAEKINGLIFDPDKKNEEKGKYGKQWFAEKVVRPKKATINFDGFDSLLERIVAVMDDYVAHPTTLP